MKTKVTHQYHNCANAKCKRPILPGETVGIVGRDNLGRDKVICDRCKQSFKTIICDVEALKI